MTVFKIILDAWTFLNATLALVGLIATLILDFLEDYARFSNKEDTAFYSHIMDLSQIAFRLVVLPMIVLMATVPVYIIFYPR